MVWWGGRESRRKETEPREAVALLIPGRTLELEPREVAAGGLRGLGRGGERVRAGSRAQRPGARRGWSVGLRGPARTNLPGRRRGRWGRRGRGDRRAAPRDGGSGGGSRKPLGRTGGPGGAGGGEAGGRQASPICHLTFGAACLSALAWQKIESQRGREDGNGRLACPWI